MSAARRFVSPSLIQLNFTLCEITTTAEGRRMMATGRGQDPNHAVDGRAYKRRHSHSQRTFDARADGNQLQLVMVTIIGSWDRARSPS